MKFTESMRENSELVRTHDLEAIERRLETGLMTVDNTLVAVADGGDTLLFYAVHSRWSEGIALFMLYGANPYTHDEYRDTTALECALKDFSKEPNNIQFAYHLKLLGYSPTDAPLLGSRDGTNAFMMAASLGHHHSLKLLYEVFDANPRIRDAYGFDALGYAMRETEWSLNRRTYFLPARENEEMSPTLGFLISVCGLDPVEYHRLYPRTLHRIQSSALRMLWASSYQRKRLTLQNNDVGC